MHRKLVKHSNLELVFDKATTLQCMIVHINVNRFKYFVFTLIIQITALVFAKINNNLI